MADEINRASPRTQSALLQAMQEYDVSVAGETYALPSPFHVLATQNPLEQEGTYPLPEAQLDRFFMQINVPYPDLEAERRMLLSTTGADEAEPTAVMTPGELASAQRLVRRLPVGESVVEAILQLVRDGRPEESGDEERYQQVLRHLQPDAGVSSPGRIPGHRQGTQPRDEGRGPAVAVPRRAWPPRAGPPLAARTRDLRRARRFRR